MTDEWGALRLSGRLLEGRSVVITGAGSPNGIGRATAKLFAAHGARVASLDIDEQGAQETAADIGEQHIDPLRFDSGQQEAERDRCLFNSQPVREGEELPQL